MRRSFSMVSLVALDLIPNDPVTKRRARTAHVSGRALNGFILAPHLLALDLDSVEASHKRFNRTPGYLVSMTSLAAKITETLNGYGKREGYEELYLFLNY